MFGVPLQAQAREKLEPRPPLAIGCPPGETKSDFCFVVCRQVLVNDATDEIPPQNNNRNWWEPPLSLVYQPPRAPTSPPVYRMVCEPKTKGWQDIEMFCQLERLVPYLAHKGRSQTLKLEHNFTLNWSKFKELCSSQKYKSGLFISRKDRFQQTYTSLRTLLWQLQILLGARACRVEWNS